MSRKHPVPEQYRAPLKSRRASADWLMAIGGREDRDGQSIFAFNVDTFRCDLSYDHLWQVFCRDRGADDEQRDPEWQALARRDYDRECRRHEVCWLHEAGLERFREDFHPGAHYGQNLDSEEVAVEWTFLGEFGEWAALLKWSPPGRPWRSYDFQQPRDPDRYVPQEEREEYWRAYFRGDDREDRMDYGDLVALYRWLVQIEHDLQPPTATEQVTIEAAYWFFDSYCDDVSERLEELRQARQLRRVTQGLAGATGAMQAMGTASMTGARGPGEANA
jgi:hypothetical protein